MSKNSTPALSRRTVFAGAGAAGAMAAAAALLPRTPQTVVAEKAPAAPDADAGYQVTPHVLRYYQTAKV
jgi:2-polyprenyl-6-methoxyphenol hydroxylase-like FAD-dependent oxidoreductase